MEYPSLDKPKAGAFRFNTDSSQMEIYDGNQWTGVLATSPELQTGGTRGIFAGGEGPGGAHSIITYVNVNSTGHAATFGDLTQNGAAYSCSSRIRGLCMMNNPDRKSVDKITIASLGDGVDWGDLVNGIWQRGGVSNSTRGMWAGGSYPGSATYDKIEAVTIASEGTAFEFGDLTISVVDHFGFASPTRGVWGGGITAPATYRDVIDYVQIATKGNAADFGNLVAAYRSAHGCSNATKGIWGGGQTPTVQDALQFVTIATLGNTVDFGNLTDARAGGGACASPTRGIWAGGYDPSKSNIIDYVQIPASGNAQDFGDLTTPTQYCGTFSNGHGGL